MTRMQKRLQAHPIFLRSIEILTVILVSGLAISIYLPFLRISAFSKLSLVVLLIWRFVIGYVPVKPIPRSVMILAVLFFLGLFISALISHNKYYEYFEYKAFKYFMIGGLLYTAPLRQNYRKFLIIILFSSAALTGLAGILQYFNVMPLGNDRPHGFTHLSTFYAAQVAFAAGAVIILLAHGTIRHFESKGDRIFLFAVTLLTSGGILVSGSRGTWMAFAAAALITLFLYNRRKSIILITMISIIMTLTLFFDSELRWRAVSTFALPVTDVQNSQGNRLELWKGSLSIFRSHPFLGVGNGDYQMNIHRLIAEKRLKDMETTIHAHSIIFQTLATQGAAGLIILSAFLVSLIRWGFKERRDHNGAGGYIILFCVFMVFFSGMTDYYFGSVKYFSACYVLVGLLGPSGTKNAADAEQRIKQPVLSR